MTSDASRLVKFRSGSGEVFYLPIELFPTHEVVVPRTLRGALWGLLKAFLGLLLFLRDEVRLRFGKRIYK